VWQVKGKEVRLLFNSTDDNQRFAKVRLAVPRGVAQWDKHLLAAALLGTHIVFYNRVSAIIPAFIAQPFKYPLGRMPLLARAGIILGQPLVNLTCVRIKLGPLDRRSTSVPGRFRIRQHLRDTVPADPKIPSYPTPAQTVLKVSVTDLQIQIHGEYPQTLPKIERAKVADFYAARDNTMPPLPWSSIAPPFTCGGDIDKDWQSKSRPASVWSHEGGSQRPLSWHRACRPACPQRQPLPRSRGP